MYVSEKKKMNWSRMTGEKKTNLEMKAKKKFIQVAWANNASKHVCNKEDREKNEILANEI